MRAAGPLLAALCWALPVAAQTAWPTPDGSWRVTEAGGLPLAAEDGVSMTLAKGHASGNAGCNRFFGGYRLMPGFTLEGPGLTRMACSGRAADVEAAVLQALTQANDWRPGAGDSLELLRDGDVVLRAVPAS
ncbi:MAG: META domain-containing protein [Rhodobacteraceae bacterium]|nr:META domain-containing protein [Paracoccaceae bacterium]